MRHALLSGAFAPGLVSRRRRAQPPRRRARVEVGDALDERRARDAEEEDAVEPVVAHAVAAVDGERDGILVDAEPAVELERDLHGLAAPDAAEVYLLLLR